MPPLTPVERKLVENSTYYQSYQKVNGWEATARLLRDRVHQNSRGDRKGS